MVWGLGAGPVIAETRHLGEPASSSWSFVGPASEAARRPGKSPERCEQVVEVPLRERARCAAQAEQCARELGLLLLQPEPALLHAARDDQIVHEHRPGLADSVGAVGRLRLRRAVPPRIVVNDGIGARQVQPRAARLQADQEHVHLAALEAIDDACAVHGGSGELDEGQAALVETESDQREHAGELREHE
jgi:hypothetical protein